MMDGSGEETGERKQEMEVNWRKEKGMEWTGRDARRGDDKGREVKKEKR